MNPEELSPVKRALLEIRQLRAQLEAVRTQRESPVAILGMGCRFPGARNTDEYWRLLLEGRDAITDTPSSRWNADAVYDADASAPGKMVSRRGGYIETIEAFDAEFFGITPREAPYVDPRQRLILEIAWEALEDAGLAPAQLAGTPTGVFLAALTADYSDILMRDLRRAEAYSGPGTATCVIANRLSYFLDLHGPSITVDTACSGSLIALHMACESLRAGECSLALAGGVSVNLLARSNVFFSKAGALSPDGQCRTFDERANGMIRSDGAGVVVLKRLSDALSAGDPIVAVIRGSATNHDGRSNGIMAPNGEAQKAVLREAYRRAGIAPSEVQYIQAHGTGTRLGDPIEVGALGEVLAPGRTADQRCVLGSVKTNIGHTEPAAGVAGVIATALALRHGVLPPTAHYERPNPLIRFDELPFEVRREAGAWPVPNARRIAGISGFGFGGSNAHVVLEEAPLAQAAPRVEAPYLLPISARTPQALRTLVSDYAARLNDDELGAICYSSSARRAHHPCRMAVSGVNATELRAALERAEPASATAEGSLVFVFSGQGSHWPGMGREAARAYPVFRETLERASAAFAAHTGWSLLDELWRDESDSRLNRTEFAQPAIYSVQVALHALWRSWGIAPDAVIGHSLGEAAAAVCAGALTLEEGARVVYERSRLMTRVAGQGMTAVVGLPLEEAVATIRGREDRVAVAGTNGPTSSVLSGDAQTLGAVMQALESRGVFCRAVAGVDIAFHSPQMDALKPELEAALSTLTPRATTVRMISTVTAAEIDGTTLNGAYWARNLREPFLFGPAIASVLKSGCATVLEVAPHAVLGSSILQAVRQSGRATRVLTSMRRNEHDVATLYAALGALYEQGRDIEWTGVYPQGGQLVSVPHYPWQRERYWWDQLPGGRDDARPARAATSHALLGPCVEPALNDGTRMHVWETTLSLDELPYLADHRVRGEAILPAAAVLDMALAAWREMHGATDVALRDVVLERPLRLDATTPARVQLTITQQGDGHEFGLFEYADGWRRTAHGRIVAAQEAPCETLAAVRARCGETVPVEAHYAALAEGGLEYGTSFRAIRQLWRGGHDALAEIQAPSAERYVLHPVVLDAALQTVSALAASDAAVSYLPSGVGTWTLQASAGLRVWAHATLQGTPGDAALEASITLWNDDGSLVGHLDGLKLSRMRARQGKSLEESLLELSWEAAPLGGAVRRTPARWLILSDSAGTGDALASKLVEAGHDTVLARVGHDYVCHDARHFSVRADNADDMRRLVRECAPIGGAVHLWSLDAKPPDAHAGAFDDGLALGCGSALHLAQALLELAPSATLSLVTRGARSLGAEPLAVAQSALWGLGLVIAQEHPALRGACVDLDPAHPEQAALQLRDELLAESAETQTAWRNGARFAARVMPREAPAVSTVALAPERTVLITGGFGALGLATARALVERGVRHLALTGRSGARGREREVAELEALGANVLALEADIAERADVDRVFETMAARMPALSGVIHAAGVLDDGVLTRQTLERFRTVLRPKAVGAWHLHERTKSMTLDFFVIYSSVASLIGSPGQANYAAGNAFVDALALQRRALGLPALSVNWGAWRSGMAESDAAQRRQSANGVEAIDPEQGIALLLSFLDTRTSGQLGVFPVHWTKFGEQFTQGIPPLLTRVIAAVPAPAKTTFDWTTLAVEAREPALRELLRTELASVLGVADTSRVPLRQGFFEIGMDSLMTVELARRLESRLGVRLPASVAIDYPNVEALAAHLLQLLGGAETKEDLSQMSTDELARLLAKEMSAGR